MTPKKARIQGACDFLDAKGIPYYKNDVFRFHNASKTAGYRALREPREYDGRTFHSTFSETRGRKRKLSDQDLATIERFLESNGFDGRSIPWDSLPAAAGLDIEVSGRTVRKRIGTLDFRRCIACSRAYMKPAAAKKRVEWARVMLERYPEPENWWHIRFSDETHFGFGPEEKVYVIRRPWERNCPDCIVSQRQPKEKDHKVLHAWAAIGHDFKSSLTWYDIPGNTNGKMTLQAYRDTILEPVVGQWLREGQTFVLEEDGDSGHGTGKSNIVKTWKEKNNLISYFNCSSSPDFPPIENAWQAPKEAVKGYAHWDPDTVKELAEEGWAKLSQEKINSWVDSIPQRLKDCIQLEGQLTGW